MPRLLFRFWIVGVVLLGPIVFTADRFVVESMVRLPGTCSASAFWVFLAAMSYLALRLFARDVACKSGISPADAAPSRGNDCPGLRRVSMRLRFSCEPCPISLCCMLPPYGQTCA